MRRTKKFIKAEKTAVNLNLAFTDENLYQALQDNNYFWDSDQGVWFEGDLPDPPTNLIKVRVWSDGERNNTDVVSIIKALGAVGFIFEEKSEPYKCRPPKQLESRTYLTFSRRN